MLPTNPQGGQYATINNILYQYNSTLSAWIRIASSVTATTSLIVTNTQTSNLYSSGALVVTGGLAIAGNLIIGNGGNLSTSTTTSLVSAIVNTNDALQLPVGTTAQRPVPAWPGMMRYNTTLGCLEVYSSTSTSWVTLYAASTYPATYLAVGGGGGGGGIGYGLIGGSINANSGASNYITMSPGSITFNGAFTVEAWVYMISGGNNVIFGSTNGYAYSTEYAFCIFDNTNAIGSFINPGICFVRSPTSGYGGSFAYGWGLGFPTLFTWTHLAVSRDINNNWYFFKNGVMGITTNTNAFVSGNVYMNAGTGISGAFGVASTMFNFDGITSGGNSTSMASRFNGYISNVRVNTTSALYTSSFTPITTSSLANIAGTNMLLNVASSGAYLTDTSGNYTLTANGTISYASTLTPLAGVAPNIGGGGGGGAGGYVIGTMTMAPGNLLTITVGQGGSAGGSAGGQAGGTGTNSIIASGTSSIAIAYGGGGGASINFTGNTGTSGASGGGGSAINVGTTATSSGGSGTQFISIFGGYGNSGGYGGSLGGGGGGGASGSGSTGTVNGGVGGTGTSTTITGIATYYAAGGGGGSVSPGVAGAGGSGSITNTSTIGGGTGSLPLAYSGSGGEGYSPSASAQAGATGTVIIAYQSKYQTATGGTVTSYYSTATSSTWWVHTFTTSSVFTA